MIVAVVCGVNARSFSKNAGKFLLNTHIHTGEHTHTYILVCRKYIRTRGKLPVNMRIYPHTHTHTQTHTHTHTHTHTLRLDW